MRKNIFLLIFYLLIATGFSTYEIELFKFDSSEELESYKVTYILDKEEDFQNGDIFTLEISNGKSNLEKVCENTLRFEDTTFFSKIICDVRKDLGENYVLIAKITREGEVISTEVSNIYISTEGSLSQSFKVNEDGSTLISIKIDSEKENFVVKQFIPKEVIAELTEENKNSLIDSELEYEILEADPLIAWNIEKAPTTINYTIKKEVSLDQREDFSLELSDESFGKKLKVLIFLLFLVVLVLLGRSLYSKKW